MKKVISDLEKAAKYDKMVATAKKYLHENHEMRLYHSCKARAKRSGVNFDMQPSDIVIPKHCKYLQVELTNIFDEGRVDTNASVDRIDNTKGYTKDNIEVISDLANRMKNSATKEQLITFAKSILTMENLLDK